MLFTGEGAVEIIIANQNCYLSTWHIWSKTVWHGYFARRKKNYMLNNCKQAGVK